MRRGTDRQAHIQTRVTNIHSHRLQLTRNVTNCSQLGVSCVLVPVLVAEGREEECDRLCVVSIVVTPPKGSYRVHVAKMDVLN